MNLNLKVYGRVMGADENHVFCRRRTIGDDKTISEYTDFTKLADDKVRLDIETHTDQNRRPTLKEKRTQIRNMTSIEDLRAAFKAPARRMPSIRVTARPLDTPPSLRGLFLPTLSNEGARDGGVANASDMEIDTNEESPTYPDFEAQQRIGRAL